MIGVLTTQKCAVCNRRLWLILMHDVHALICGPCDMRAAPECEPELRALHGDR